MARRISKSRKCQTTRDVTALLAQSWDLRYESRVLRDQIRAALATFHTLVDERNKIVGRKQSAR